MFEKPRDKISSTGLNKNVIIRVAKTDGDGKGVLYKLVTGLWCGGSVYILYQQLQQTLHTRTWDTLHKLTFTMLPLSEHHVKSDTVIPCTIKYFTPTACSDIKS